VLTPDPQRKGALSVDTSPSDAINVESDVDSSITENLSKMVSAPYTVNSAFLEFWERERSLK
jgi:hypothetical protein